MEETNPVVIKPIGFVELVENVCKRSRMHTRYGTLAEIVAFLDGAGCAVGVGGHLPFTNFLSALSKQLNHPESHTPWEFLLNIYGSEEKVLDALPKLYREYAAQSFD